MYRRFLATKQTGERTIFANRLASRMLDHAIIVTRQRRAGTVFDRGFSSLMAESFPAGSCAISPLH